MTPIQLDDLFLVTANIQPGMTRSEIETELKKMLLANTYAAEFTRQLKEGTLSPGFCSEYADVLAECDTEPYIWLDHVQTNTGIILASSIPYDI